MELGADFVALFLLAMYFSPLESMIEIIGTTWVFSEA